MKPFCLVCSFRSPGMYLKCWLVKSLLFLYDFECSSGNTEFLQGKEILYLSATPFHSAELERSVVSSSQREQLRMQYVDIRWTRKFVYLPHMCSWALSRLNIESIWSSWLKGQGILVQNGCYFDRLSTAFFAFLTLNLFPFLTDSLFERQY